MSLSTYHHLFQPGTDATASPLLLLHGTGGNERDLLPLARSLAPRSAVLSPRGDVSEHGALRFFARQAEGRFDPAEVTRRTHALADFIAAASTHYDLDPARLTAIGFSNGANIAATILQLRPAVLGGAVLLRSMVVFDQTATPASLTGKRVLLLNGTADPIAALDHPPPTRRTPPHRRRRRHPNFSPSRPRPHRCRSHRRQILAHPITRPVSFLPV